MFRSARRCVPSCGSLHRGPRRVHFSCLGQLDGSGLADIRAAIQSRRRPSLPCPPPLPCRRGSSPTVSRFRITMSLTNFTDTRNRAAAARCECPSSTKATTRSRSAIGCGLPISTPHICPTARESQIRLHGNPESKRSQLSLEDQFWEMDWDGDPIQGDNAVIKVLTSESRFSET